MEESRKEHALLAASAALQSRRGWPGPALPACLKPTTASFRHWLADPSTAEPSTPSPPNPLALQDPTLCHLFLEACVFSPNWGCWLLGSPTALLLYLFAGPLIPLRFKSPVSCFRSPREPGNFLRAEVGVMQDRWGWGHWSSEFPTGQF